MDRHKKGVLFDATVMVGATVVAYLAVSWILRHPDAARTANMRACLVVRRTAQTSADMLQKIADDAGTRYNALRV